MNYGRKKNTRIKNCYFRFIEPVEYAKYWYYPHLNDWIDEDKHPEVVGRDCASFEQCKSLKSAIRKVNKASVPKGTIFRLVSKYVGYDIRIIKR